MSLFGLIKRPKSAPNVLSAPVRRDLPWPAEAPASAAPIKVSSDELRQMLFDAIATGDEPRLARLCREHHDFIRDYADVWMIVPDSLLGNLAAVEWYTQGVKNLTHLSASASPQST